MAASASQHDPRATSQQSVRVLSAIVRTSPSYMLEVQCICGLAVHVQKCCCFQSDDAQGLQV